MVGAGDKVGKGARGGGGEGDEAGEGGCYVIHQTLHATFVPLQ